MKKIFALLLLLCSLSANADVIRALITITNAPTNGMTLTVNSDVRTWTSSVTIAASQIATNATVNGSATNLYNQILANGYAGPVNILMTNAASVLLIGQAGGAMAVTASAGWATVLLTTNSSTNGYTVRVPYLNESSAIRTTIGNGLVDWLNNTPTTALAIGGTMQNFVNKSGAENVGGIKTFTSAAQFSAGATVSGTSGTQFIINNPVKIVSLSTNTNSITGGLAVVGNFLPTTVIGGTFNTPLLTNTPVIKYPTVTGGTYATPTNSGIVYGTNYSSSLAPDQFLDLGDGAARPVSLNDGDGVGIYLFSGGASVTVNALSLEVTNSTGQGGITADAFALKTITLNTTNNSGLANGNNAGVKTGQGVIVAVSGPTAAFTINGLVGGSDGRYVIIRNATGYNMTIGNESGLESTAANRIKTGIGASITLTNVPSFVHLYYNGTSSRWEIDSSSN